MLDLDTTTASLLDRFGFDAADFEALQRAVREGSLSCARSASITSVSALHDPDTTSYAVVSDAQFRKGGIDALRERRVASVILAGGMATRFGRIVKATATAVDGHTFLGLKLRALDALAREHRTNIPVVVLSSFATHDAIASFLAGTRFDGITVRLIAQGISLLVDEHGAIAKNAEGRAVPYAPGHGDLLRTLTRSGKLDRLRAEGIDTLFVSNVDNLAATLNLGICGFSREYKELLFEVVVRQPGDVGGLVGRIEGQPQVVERSRLAPNARYEGVATFNTNTLWIPTAMLPFTHELPWSLTHVASPHDPAHLRAERLLGEMSRFVTTRFVVVPRDGTDSRFEPIKDLDDLARREARLAALLTTRGAI